jgi:hypothetical protein
MADLNQFRRSKDRLAEIHCYLMTKQNPDEQTHSYIRTIELSIKTLDQKIEELGFRDQRLVIGD